ncbi:hypothetical protein O988_03019 [Pseudogymnoascus sp. VKM F-3808]|nr:hypothetical protein O988_03019 [Pseudogymnoascus sp. VKM F-3808]
MLRPNLLRQALCTRHPISEAISNTGLRRAMHITTTLHPRYSRSSHTRRKSTVDRATIFTNPRSHGKSIIISKWSQSTESNNVPDNVPTNSGTGIMSPSTTANVGFEIISANDFARLSKRYRCDLSMESREIREGFGK